MTQNNDDYVNPFLTITETGALVDRRISSPTAARTIYAQFQADDSQEAARRGRLANIYNGNLPYDPEKLRALNLANLANFNTGELRGFVDGRCDVITDLALDTTPLIELRPHPQQMAGPQAERFSEIIADEFSLTVRDANRLLPCLAMMFRECDLYGLGPVTWTSRSSYTPVALRRGQIKFRSDGPITSTDHELFMFETHVPIHYFRRIFDSKDAARKEGWNPEAVIQFLVDVFEAEKPTETESGDTTGTSTLESSIIEMRQNRWLETSQFKTINVVHTLVKETDGRIRHTLHSPGPGVEEWLYDREGAYDDMDKCFIWMPASVVESEARGARGAASIIAPIADINNRLMCQMYDLGFRTGTINLVSRSPQQHHQASIVERGPYTLIPGDLEFPSHPPSGNSNLQQLASLRDLGNNVAVNSATGSRGGIGSLSERMTMGADRKTKEEIQVAEQARARSEQMLFAARTLALDLVFRETFRRFAALVNGPASGRKAYPEVDKFMERCILRGVTEEALKNLDDLFGVYTNRILVTGGGQAHAGILGGLLQTFGGSFDEQGRMMAVRDMVRFQLGSKSADRYRPEGNRDSAPSNATSLAVLENDAMQRGGQAVVGNDQFHWTHIPIHMTVLGQFIQQYQEDPQSIQEPQQVLDVMQAVSEHVQTHVQFGGQQPGMDVVAKQVMQQLASMAPVVKGLTMMAGTIERQRRAAEEKAMREQAALEEQAAGRDAQVAMHESDNKASLKAREQDLMHDVRLRKVEQDGEIALRKAENETRVNVARQTGRVQQGASILGYNKPGVTPPPSEQEFEDAGEGGGQYQPM